MKVHIDYFTVHGKWYSQGNCDIDCTEYDLKNGLRRMFHNKIRPGLVDGDMEFFAVAYPIDGENGVPVMVFPDWYYQMTYAVS